jgi:hypothetical protein
MTAFVEMGHFSKQIILNDKLPDEQCKKKLMNDNFTAHHPIYYIVQ